MGSSNTTGDGSLLLAIGNALLCIVKICIVIGGVRIHLSGEVGGTTLGHLENDRSLSIAGGFERGNDSGGGGDVLAYVKTGKSGIGVVLVLTMAGMANLCS